MSFLKSYSDNSANVTVSNALVHLCLEHSMIDNTGVSMITRKLKFLRSFSIRECAHLTDISLLFIADNVGSRLEMLHTDIKQPDSAETDAFFVLMCTALTYLNVDCGDKMLCAGRGSSLIITGCTKLETPVVNKYSTISASSRHFASLLRPELKLFVHDSSTAYDVLSMPV